ncbi:MAG: ATP-dependent DNA helicase PcrA [Deltaproteobacteria bacterium]|nr:MAG: ATP-dependent DNA helicase PcrA [Deltaproteobacteria bacterium]
MNLDTDLNPEQRQAVLHGQGPLLVLAGAGSGKTRVITYRIAHLLEHHGVEPWQVLAVTFTNKAAGEMQERVQTLCGRAGVWISTFHSLGARLLRRHAERLGRSPDFVIYDDKDSQRLGAAVCEELKLEADGRRVERLLRKVEACKHRLLEPRRAGHLDGLERAFYRLYQQRLERANAFDFADLIFRLQRLWAENPDLLEKYRRRFRHVLVDEFQDTDRAQYGLLRLLCPPETNLCVVGDDDQAIYNWRDADVAHILNFERDYPGATVIRLERNYRSTAVILEAANRVIAANRRRHRKRLRAQSDGGEPVRVLEFVDEQQEATFVAGEAQRLLEQGRPLAGLAVFYRINALSRALEEALRLYGLPYRIVGGTRFYDRREIRDVLAYLRLLVNPHSDVDFLRVYNLPPRGIGKVTRQRLEQLARESGQSLFATCRPDVVAAGVARGRWQRLVEFRRLLESLATESRDRPAAEIVSLVVERSGYRRWLAGDDPEGSRLANVEELAASAGDFGRLAGDTSLAAFLEHVALVTAEDLSGQQDGVQLMTLHAAKGLEFEQVIMVGVEEGLLPLIRNPAPGEEDDGTDIEEERRLCYVGMTRARRRLVMSWCRTRSLYGRGSYKEPSRFLQALAEPEEAPATGGDWDRRPGWLEGGGVMRGRSRPADDELELDCELDDDDGLVVDYDDEFNQDNQARPEGSGWLGRRVEHARFGSGLVRGARPSRQGLKLDIDFEHAGRKTVLERFVRPA